LLTNKYILLFLLQRDFLESGGFGEMLGNDISKLAKAIGPCKKVLAAARAAGMLVIHTREGHRTHLVDVHPHKKQRMGGKQVIGTQGPLGKILIRGEAGHDIIPELYPLVGEPVIDKVRLFVRK
jgi:nicotinamidase-related amidase